MRPTRNHQNSLFVEEERWEIRTVNCRDDVNREDIGVNEIRLSLELLNDLEVGESPRMPSLVPVGIELSGSLVRLEDIVVVLKIERKRTKSQRTISSTRRRTKEGETKEKLTEVVQFSLRATSHSPCLR